MAPPRSTWLLGAAIAAFAALLAFPLRHGGAYLDDFLFLALGRHIQDPLALLTQDSLGAYFFRPLPMFSWWATVAAFGTGAPAQLACNVALHAVNAALLYALLRRLGLRPAPAALSCLVFVAHPTAFAASAWLSDRFDLMATAFGLAALLAIERFLAAPAAARMAAAIAALLAALLSKEIAYVFPVAATLMVAWPIAGRHTASGRARAALFAAVAVASLAALGLRTLVLRNVTEALFAREGWSVMLAGGVSKWVAQLPGFLVVRHGNALAIGAWVAWLALLVTAAAARGSALDRNLGRIAALGVTLMAASALAQSPVLRAMALEPFTIERFAFESLAGSRLYYVPLAGFAMVLGALAQLAAGALASRGARALAVAASVAALVGLLATSRAIGREWTAYLGANITPVLEAAIAALEPRTDLHPGCKIYLLSMPAAPGLREVLDTAVKQALPARHPLMGCFIQSERSPWYNLLESRGLPDGSERPLETMIFAGKPFPPLRVSNLTYYYLTLRDRAEPLDDSAATFLAYEAGRFVDVTGEVRQRRRPVRFEERTNP